MGRRSHTELPRDVLPRLATTQDDILEAFAVAHDGDHIILNRIFCFAMRKTPRMEFFEVPFNHFHECFPSTYSEWLLVMRNIKTINKSYQPQVEAFPAKDDWLFVHFGDTFEDALL